MLRVSGVGEGALVFQRDHYSGQMGRLPKSVFYRSGFGPIWGSGNRPEKVMYSEHSIRRIIQAYENRIEIPTTLTRSKNMIGHGNEALLSAFHV